MKALIRRAARRVAIMLAALIRPIVTLTLPLMAWIIARIVRGNDAYPVFSQKGLYLLRKHYYTPIPEEEDCTNEYWNSTSELVGIEIDADGIASYVEQELAPFREEFGQYPIHKQESDEGFFLLNGGFMAVDGDMYYSLIRHVKPSQIIEVGCGFSTLVASEAIRKGQAEGARTKLVCIEPYPSPQLRTGDLAIDRMLEIKVQQVDPDEFTALGKDDILFIDTTHVLKSGGDVQFLYCEVLPRLSSGVLVHIHDISLPRHYPKVYYEKNYYFWNEQYLLQAFLTHNSRVEVIWPGNYLMVHRPEWMLRTFPTLSIMREKYPSSEPSSFWFRMK